MSQDRCIDWERPLAVVSNGRRPSRQNLKGNGRRMCNALYWSRRRTRSWRKERGVSIQLNVVPTCLSNTLQMIYLYLAARIFRIPRSTPHIAAKKSLVKSGLPEVSWSPNENTIARAHIRAYSDMEVGCKSNPACAVVLYGHLRYKWEKKRQAARSRTGGAAKNIWIPASGV